MLSVFTNVVLPVFVIAALGGIVGRWRKVEVKTLTAMVFYLFSPALVFNSMANTELSLSLGARLLMVTVGGWIAMLVIAAGWSIARGHDASMRAGYLLAVTSPNVGNMGLPVATLAFGEIGLQIAVINFVVGAVLTNSGGIAIGATAGGNPRAALTAPFRYPYMYAAALGLVVRATDVELPVAVSSPLATLSGAAIPVMLVVLGLQLRDVATRADVTDTVSVIVARTTVAPAAAFAIATMVGLDGVERGTMTVLAAMPVAVVTTIVAAEFGARVDFVTRSVVLTTLMSVVTLTPLIDIVR